MCGRYFIDIDDAELEEIVREAEKNILSLSGQAVMKTSGEIFPTDIVPVITAPRQYQPMKWGFVAIKGRPVINARSETVYEKPMFKESMTQRRCLIPASGYYEWALQPGESKKTKYAFHVVQSPMYFAGCFRWEKSSEIPHFVILTREATGIAATIHGRMPVILPKPRIEDWLGGASFAFTESMTTLARQPA